MSPEKMSNECAVLLVKELYVGNFNTNIWQLEFLKDTIYHKKFTLAQKKVIYQLAHKFRIL